MKLPFSDQAWEDYLYWQKTDNRVVKRINLLIKEIFRSAHEGIGKPEPLKHALSGYCHVGLMMNIAWCIRLQMKRS